MVLRNINAILKSTSTDCPLIPPTDLYNEGWLVRLFLQWFSQQLDDSHPLSFSKECRWFSEALLPTQFRAEYRGDSLSESWTHADGVIGQFEIGKTGRGDLALSADAKRFVVVEAKMFSKLSSGVTHARYFDQAARTVACIAEVLNRADRKPDKMARLGFYVLAPSKQIDAGIFTNEMKPGNIESKVKRRIEEYEGHRSKKMLKEKRNWFKARFKPILENIDLRCIGWEELIEYCKLEDPQSGKDLKQFYRKCLEYNRTEKKILPIDG